MSLLTARASLLQCTLRADQAAFVNTEC
jgi:hypothetical protein